MKLKHFLSLSGLGPENLAALVDNSLAIAEGRESDARPLNARTVGIYFRRSSTRTRTAFTVGAMRLGGHIIQYGPNDLQLVTGETFKDTGLVLSGFLDILVVRTNDPIEEMMGLADQDEMAVINAMSNNEHPSQAIADLVTIKEAFGHLDDIHVLYVGEGNNSASALALAVAQTPGMRLTLVTPEGYGLCSAALEDAKKTARHYGSDVQQLHDLEQLPRGVDVVYTTRWQTMGVPKADPDWRQRFDPYRVDLPFMTRVSKPSGTVFMHDLPAVRGAEVVDEVLDGPQSVAFRQARHKLTSAMAIMSWCANSH